MLKNILFISFLLISLTFLLSDEIYIIKNGDNLYQISKKYHISIEDIIRLNEISDITSLSVGMELKISENEPENLNLRKYTVSKGDTLFSISKKLNLSLSSLMEYNNLKIGDIISLGQDLVLGPIAAEAVVEVPIAVAVNVAKPVEYVPYWPIEGDISKYSGRIQGVKIEGHSGDYIQAVSTGRVIWYDSFKGIGKVVLIEGENGFDYLYGTKESLNVSMGVHINAGERLGRLKESNTSIIFSVFKNGKPLSDISKAPR